jgi:hypothetical protein
MSSNAPGIMLFVRNLYAGLAAPVFCLLIYWSEKEVVYWRGESLYE